MGCLVDAYQILLGRDGGAGHISLPGLIRDGNDVPRADRPLVSVKWRDRQRLVELAVADAEDVVPSEARDLEERAVNAKGKVVVVAAALALGRDEVGEVLKLAVVGPRIGAAAEDASAAAVAAGLGGIAGRVEHVPDVVDLVELGRPHVGAARGVGVCPDGALLAIDEPVECCGADDGDLIVGGEGAGEFRKGVVVRGALRHRTGSMFHPP